MFLSSTGFSKIGGFPGLLERYGSAISAVNLSSTDGESLILNIESVAESNALAGIKPSVDSVAASPNISTSLTCALPPSKAFVMLRDISDPEMPWLGYVLGQTPASIWYWCADQVRKNFFKIYLSRLYFSYLYPKSRQKNFTTFH